MCPLCKHDYYVPKPRPEGVDAVEAERLARRGQRMGPTPPQYAFMGGRGGMNPFRPGGRFMTIVYQDDPRRSLGRFPNSIAEPRPARRSDRGAPDPAGTFDPTTTPALNNAQQAGFWSRVSNFGIFTSPRPAMPSIHMPTRLRRGNNADTASTEVNVPTEMTPGQLEAGRAQT